MNNYRVNINDLLD
jgi:hypothetical protein